MQASGQSAATKKSNERKRKKTTKERIERTTKGPSDGEATAHGVEAVRGQKQAEE